MLNDLKTYAGRKLNELEWDPPEMKRWARHGSTRYLNDEGRWRAIRYVVEEQGDPIAMYRAPFLK